MTTISYKAGDKVTWYGRLCVVLSVVDEYSVSVREVRTGKVMMLMVSHLEAAK